MSDKKKFHANRMVIYILTLMRFTVVITASAATTAPAVAAVLCVPFFQFSVVQPKIVL